MVGRASSNAEKGLGVLVRDGNRPLVRGADPGGGVELMLDPSSKVRQEFLMKIVPDRPPGRFLQRADHNDPCVSVEDYTTTSTVEAPILSSLPTCVVSRATNVLALTSAVPLRSRNGIMCMSLQTEVDFQCQALAMCPPAVTGRAGGVSLLAGQD